MKKRKRELNPFEQYLEWLKDGTLLSQPLQIGFRAFIRENENIPEGIKNLLAGGEGTGGMIGDIFKLLYSLIGNMEIAYRRGHFAGREEKQKEFLSLCKNFDKEWENFIGCINFNKSNMNGKALKFMNEFPSKILSFSGYAKHKK